MDFEKFLRMMIDSRDENTIVKKTYPLKKDWDKRFKELIKLQKEIEQMEGRHKALKKGLWSEIELDLNDFSGMRYNKDTNEIEVLEQVDGDKPIKSPIQMGL